MSRNDHLNHRPDEAGCKNIETLRGYIIALEEIIDDLVPDSREKSIAKTKLEEVRMWGVKGIVLKHSTGVDEIGDQGNVSGATPAAPSGPDGEPGQVMTGDETARLEAVQKAFGAVKFQFERTAEAFDDCALTLFFEGRENVAGTVAALERMAKEAEGLAA